MNLLKRIQNAAIMLFQGGEIPLQGMGQGWGQYDLGRLLLQGGSAIDWAGEAEPYYNNPIVAICGSKIAGMVNESEIQGQKWDVKRGEWVADESYQPFKAFLPLIERPNEFDTFASIEFAMAMAEAIYGEAYLFVRRNLLGQPIGFRWIANERITPMSNRDNADGTKAVTHYEYRPPTGGNPIDLPVTDVLMFKRGIHPKDLRRGWSPVLTTVRQIVLHNDTATRQAGLIRNPGAGRLIHPKTGDGKQLPAREQIQQGANLINELVRDRSGRTAMVPFEVGIAELSVDPSKLDLSGVSKQSVDLICAAFGGDPMAFGLPSDSKTYSNLEESLDALGKQTVLPMLSRFGETFTQFAVREFRLDPRLYRIAYDHSDVSWLADEIDQEQERHRENFKVGGMTLASFKAKIGEEPVKGDESLTYFDLLNAGRTIALTNSHEHNHGISDHAKNLVTKDQVYRARFGKPQTNARPKTAKANPFQDRHDVIIRESNNALLRIANKYRAGEIEDLQFRDQYSAEIKRLHEKMYALGIDLSGSSTTPEDIEAVGVMMRDFEQTFIQGLAQDIANGRYADSENGLANRVQMYANKGSSTASRGFLDGSPDQDEFYWDMTIAEHCEDCPYLEASSPFLKETLYTTPRGGDTACLSNCKCRLVRGSDGQTGFGPI